MKKIEIAQTHVFYLVICAEKDVSKEDILAFAEHEHPSGTEAGWYAKDTFEWQGTEYPNPSPCQGYQDRVHWIIKA